MQIEYTKQAENVLKTARSAAKELRHPILGQNIFCLDCGECLREWQVRSLRQTE